MTGTPAALAGLDARFDHVAVAGPTFPAMLALYRDVLGGVLGGGGTNARLGFSTLEVRFADRHVELLAPLAGSTFLDGFLARSGGRGGLHHVTFTVPDLRLAVARLQEAGYSTFGENLDDPSWAEAFVHPRDAGGVLLQVAQKGGQDGLARDWQPLAEASYAPLAGYSPPAAPRR